MLAIAYHFPVLPRHQDQFRHAYRSARDGLRQTMGLVAHEFNDPRNRSGTFTLLMAWNDQASFERFTRTWIGVWMLNGMGLPRDAFATPISTNIGEEEFALRAGKRAA